MTIINHELKRGGISLIIWTVSIAFLIVTCVFMFPEMKNEMDNVSDMFASMGSFSEAFGMNELNFGTLIGFYSVECGNILGLGGAFFASLIAVSTLSKEEKEHTAEFLLSHPVSRNRIITGKLIAVLIQIVIMNVIVYGASLGSIALIGEEIPFKEISLLHLSFFIMQIELGGICFAVSAFLKRGSIGVGLGIAILMYFLNIISNISDSADFLKYITPFGYANGADIVRNLSLDTTLVLLGISYSIIAVIIAYIKYNKKDIS